MRTLAVWTLMAAVMIASQPSYAFGDLLFYTIAAKSMEKSTVPQVAPPVPTTAMPCTTANTVAAARGELDEEDLEALDASCGDHKQEVSAGMSAPGFSFSVTEETCRMWYPTTAVLGSFGAWSANPPEGYVRYGTGYAHKSCVPVDLHKAGFGSH